MKRRYADEKIWWIPLVIGVTFLIPLGLDNYFTYVFNLAGFAIRLYRAHFAWACGLHGGRCLHVRCVGSTV